MKVARGFIEFDEWGFSPHIGIAKGLVTIGYVGTPKMYNCSAFGKPVSLAARHASIADEQTIVVQANQLDHLQFDNIFGHARNSQRREGSWELQEPETETLKNMGEVEICKIKKNLSLNFIFNDDEEKVITIEDRIKTVLDNAIKVGKYIPLKS